MNPILEGIHPDNDVVARRQARGYPPLAVGSDPYTTYLHLEMWLCYLNGLDHAAVVTACALIDFAVKDAIHFDVYVKSDCNFKADEWDKIDGLDFGKTINMAKSRSIVTKDESKKLDWIRQHFRNVYLHGETPHWLKDKDADVSEGNLETGEVRDRTIPLRDNLAIQRQYRIAADRNACNVLVPLVNGFVRTLAKRSLDAIETWKAKNPSKPTRDQVDRVLDNMRKQGMKPDVIIMNELPADLISQELGSESVPPGTP